MPTRVRRSLRPRRARATAAAQSLPARPEAARLALDARSPDRLLDRLLAVPDLADVVPRLPPEVVHRVIQRCGLEDSGQFVALATPDQLARVFDLDLWRPAMPGLDEQFDADRFGVWLEVLA